MKLNSWRYASAPATCATHWVATCGGGVARIRAAYLCSLELGEG